MADANGGRIITREREQEERLIRQGKRIDKMSPTIGEVKEMMTELYGPMAALLREMCVRQALLEDWFRLTFVPSDGEVPDHFVEAEVESLTGTTGTIDWPLDVVDIRGLSDAEFSPPSDAVILE